MRRNPISMMLAAVTLLGACGAPSVGEDAGEDPVDSGTERDSGADPDAGEGLDVLITAPPPAITHVRGTVDLQIVVRGGTADEVEIWKDGAILAVLPPPYTYPWNTDPEAEGAHVIEARAIQGGAVAAREQRTFTVDRTPPWIVDRRPAVGSTNAALAEPITIELSEPILATSLPRALHLTLPSGPLAHTVSQPEPHVVELLPTERPATMPATATVTVDATITDLAGNALEAADAWSITYPGWVRHPRPGGASSSSSVLDATVGPDGTVWVLCKHSAGPNDFDLELWAWDGSAWTATPAIIRDGASYLEDGEVRVRPSGHVVVAWKGYSAPSTYETRVGEWDGAAFTEYAPPPRDTQLPAALELELEADGAVVLARRLGLEVLVHRYTDGAWTTVGTPLMAEASDPAFTDLLPTPEGLLLSHVTSHDCSVARESGAAWTSLSPIYVGTVSSSCSAARLVRAPDAVLHAFVRTSSPTGTGFQTRVLAGTSTSWEMVANPLPIFTDVTPAATGWYVLGTTASPITAFYVVDETGAHIREALPADAGLRVLERDGAPIVLSRESEIFEINDVR